MHIDLHFFVNDECGVDVQKTLFHDLYSGLGLRI